MMTRFTVEHDCSRDYFCALILELIYVAYACVCSIICTPCSKKGSHQTFGSNFLKS